MMQHFFKKWCQFKNVYEKEKAEILAIEDEDKRQKELNQLNANSVRMEVACDGNHNRLPYCYQKENRGQYD